ncbi:coiled-coil domain-containing protein 102A-like [Corticium candelabrum]|uniref:coiled-coil domain-containing protein 102A-like n=1 Tax=Corticium candelabrum TaxID=121492 RepID=UPI002E26596A|nr:coiled-coil domain-containing protein 102A-like [Corticium candelabrum]
MDRDPRKKSQVETAGSSKDLDEARTKAAQMEKTMRWWSDCTASWREKWTRAKSERDKSREENRQLKARLDDAWKELASIRREKHSLAKENERLRAKLGVRDDDMRGSSEDGSTFGSSPAGPSSTYSPNGTYTDVEVDGSASPSLASRSSSEQPPGILHSEVHFIEQILARTERMTGQQQALQTSSDNGWGLEETRMATMRKIQADVTSQDEVLMQEIAALTLKLEESQKIIARERSAKAVVDETADKLQQEVQLMKERCEELRRDRTEALQQLRDIRNRHDKDIAQIQVNLDEESGSRATSDKKLKDLRAQLEKLQEENAAEWGRREQLETEKMTLEREKKKFLMQIEDLETTLARKNRQIKANMDADMKTLQTEFHEKSKELSELKHNHNRLKKQMLDQAAELEHSKRLIEQRDQEVKQLRIRVEDLKRQMVEAQDSVDMKCNSERKLQRTIDEQQEQIDNLQTQLGHQLTRLKRQSPTPAFSRTDNEQLEHYSSEED